MARTSSGGGSRFASANLNDLYGKQALPSIGSSKSRYLHGNTHSGMLVLARPNRSQPNKTVKPQPKLTVPAPVNLPSLRKEHAGNDPNITLVPSSGVSGWSKQQQQQQSSSASLEDSNEVHTKGNGWGIAPPSAPASGGISSDGSSRPGKYTPPAARGITSSRPGPPPTTPSSVVLRGEDFPTLQAAVPLHPVQQQQHQRKSHIKQQQQQVMKEQDDGKPSSPPVLALQPQSKQQNYRDESAPRNNGYFPFKENRKPGNDMSFRPAPLLHLNHTSSNWAEDERETASVARPPSGDWEESGQRYYSRNEPVRPDRMLSSHYGRENEVGMYHRRENEYSRPDSGWGNRDRDRDSSWRNTGFDSRNAGFDRPEMEHNRWRDNYSHSSGFRDGFSFHKTTVGRFRNGGFDLPVRRSTLYSDDAFTRDFPELDLRYDARQKMRRRKEEQVESGFRDLERESFETELERVQKEQEQERQRKIEERERAMELARKEQEERERLAREEEERQRRIEEEAREAAARAEEEALEAIRKVEETKRAREEEKRRMAEEEERRKENARRKLLELEERIAKRELDKKQQQKGAQDKEENPVRGGTPEEEDDRAPGRFSQSRVQESRLRSPEYGAGYGMGRDLRDSLVRDTERLRPSATSSWRREPDTYMHSPSFRERRMSEEAESFYGNMEGFPREDKWSNGDSLRNVYSPQKQNNFMDHSYLDEDRRWNRRAGIRDSRPFSPPSPTSYGYDTTDGLSYGRLRQSLPKQPRVPPPPSRSRPSSSIYSTSQTTSPVVSLSSLEPSENPEPSVTEPTKADEGEVNVVPDNEETVEIEAKAYVEEEPSQTNEKLPEAVEYPQENEDAILSENEKSVIDSVGGSEEAGEPLDEMPGISQEFVEHQTEILLEETVEEVTEFNVTSESLPEAVQLDNGDVSELAYECLDNPSLHSLPGLEKEEVEETSVEAVVEIIEEQRTEEFTKDNETPASSRPSEGILPSPAPGDRQPVPPVLNNGMQHNFHPPPNFLPLLEPRPRMQAPPRSDRPMTLQFGLLPGTSLLQGSIPAIQIGSIQMPLQLHPPIGHHVTHMQPPPQFQFGQIGQQAPLLPFTVHPQAMMQPSVMNMDGNQAAQFRMQPHPERTYWTHQIGQPGGGQVVQPGLAHETKETEEEKVAEEAKIPEEKGEASTVQSVQKIEDDFIEVRSKRQLLREQKEKQVKAKPKYTKNKDQGGRQRNAVKNTTQGGKNESSALQNCSLDVVVTASRARQVALSNPEVGFEKRTKSPQPSQINPLVSDAPAFPPIVAEGQANGPVSWGFNRPNQEVVNLTQVQLEEAMKPVRFEVPIPAQVPLSEHLNTSSALDTTTTSKENPGPAAAPGPLNSLLAGEKIQFGAVTMPAYVSPVAWGPTRTEGFLESKEAQDENELQPFGKGNELPPFGKNKRLRENEEGSGIVDSEAEAEAAASAVAVAAISNDDYVHNSEHANGAVSTNKASPAGMTSQPTPSQGEETMSVSLPADLSVDMSLRGSSHSNRILPGGFPSMEMGPLVGGPPVFAAFNAADGARDTPSERPAGPPSWQPHHSGVDSFYGGPHGYAGPFGPIPSIPPHTLVYTSPFGHGQFGQLGVSYMGPAAHMPVKQPDWKHTPSTSSGTSGNDLGNYGNRHIPHEPSVISVVPPGPFDVYRDMTFQSQWSHIPGPHAPIPFPMQLRHPHPAYHHMQQHQQTHQPENTHTNSNSVVNEVVNPTSNASPPSDQQQTGHFPDDLGLISTTSDTDSSSYVQPPKSPSPVSLPPGSKLRSRVGQPIQPLESSRPNSGNAGNRPGFQYSPRRPAGNPPDKRNERNVSVPKGGTVPVSGWGNQNRKGRPAVGLSGDKSNSSNLPAAAKLKQVYVVKPSSSGNSDGSSTVTEVFTADARHM